MYQTSPRFKQSSSKNKLKKIKITTDNLLTEDLKADKKQNVKNKINKKYLEIKKEN